MSIKYYKLSLMIVLLANLICSSSVIAKDSSLAINEGSCIKCHKRNGKIFGLHANDAMGLDCQSCHGEKGKHPRKPNSVVRFGIDAQTQVAKQVEVCMECHDPQLLSIADWTHDVHANKVACSGCHQLHLEVDPMIGLEPKQHSQLCRDCHAKKEVE